MLSLVLAARLRSRPVAFERWRRRAITAVDADIAGWPLDEYAKVVPGPSSSPGDAEGAFERVRERIL
ncbi:MAG: hypothetical protein H0W00_03895, partial [Chloroflexi bacterium]|nr:hypothetical protein [Chloroflexota bacterium]